MVQPLAVNDDIPAESDIYLVVRGLKVLREGVQSVIHAEDLKGWCQEDKREKDP